MLRWWTPACLIVTLAFSQTARAQSDADLERARQLFAEAFSDENAGRCAEALDKYRRVQAVKDTPNVRFRIGSCSEKTGQLRAAMRSYDGAIRLGRGDPRSKDVVAEAEKQIESLAPHMGRLVLHKPDIASVRIDDEQVSELEAKEPVWLDPGPHVVTATAPGFKPYRSDVTIRERETEELAIALEPEPVSTPPPRPPLPPPPSPPPLPPSPSHARAIAGWSLVGLGGALGVAMATSLVVRETSIASINDACKMGCPIARKSELEQTRERALIVGPLAAVFGSVGGAAIVAGAILILTEPKQTAVSAWIGANVAGLMVARRF